MRDAVEGDAVLERRHRELVVGRAAQKLARLVVELGHGGCAGTACRLIGRNDDAGDFRQVIEGFQGNDHLDGRAVRVGDDARVPRHVARVHLGNHQGHVLVHAECARVVNHDGTRGNHGLAHRLGNIGACGEQRDVNAFERLGSHFLHSEIACGNVAATLEGKLLASRARRRERAHLACREVQVMQDLQELISHSTRRTGNSDNRMSGDNLRPSHVYLPIGPCSSWRRFLPPKAGFPRTRCRNPDRRRCAGTGPLERPARHRPPRTGESGSWR